MPITSADIRHLLSGGASNANLAQSIGGVKSSVAASALLFPHLSVAEQAAGKTEYRCYYVQNNHATLTLTSAVAWISSDTPSNLTDFAIGLGTSAINGTETAAANTATAPAGVTFVQGADKAGGIALGSLAPGESRAIWLRRITTPGSVTTPVADPATIRVEGDTL